MRSRSRSSSACSAASSPWCRPSWHRPEAGCRGSAARSGAGDLIVESGPDLHLQTREAELDGILGKVEHLVNVLPPMLTPTGNVRRSPPHNRQRGSPARCARDVPHGGFDPALGEDRAFDPGVALPQRRNRRRSGRLALKRATLGSKNSCSEVRTAGVSASAL